MKREEILENLSELMNSLYESGKLYIQIPKKDTVNYEDDYWHKIIDPDGKERNRLEERDQFLEDIDYIIKFLNSLSTGRILDIGCGLGWLLSALNDCWKKYGVEISQFASNYAKRSYKVFNGPFIDYNCEDNFFDVVILHHVIEHMEDPLLNVLKIKKILKKNGFLIIGTPDFDSGCARRFGKNYRLLNDITHISLFSNDSMHRFLREHGFKIIKVEYPFFKTRFFTKENLMRLFDVDKISPPFYGNFMTFFSINQKD